MNGGSAQPGQPARSNLTIVSAEVCDRGKVREENQDSVHSAKLPIGELLIVADGIGGYKGGATASRMVVDGFLSQLAQYTADYPANLALQEACNYTNMSIFRTAASSDPALHRMGSTVVLALIQLSGNEGPVAYVGHVGDSRAYLVRDGRMQKITNDHSVVQSLLSRKLITEEEARKHPDASVLTRSLGHRPEVEIEIDRLPLQPGDALLLCSDGLWGYVPDAHVAAVVTETNLSVETIGDTLLHQALAAGGYDNIGIEFARLSERSPKADATHILRAKQAEVAVKPIRSVRQSLAMMLLLFGACGYLGYSAFKDDRFHLKKTKHAQAQAAVVSQTPPAKSTTSLVGSRGTVAIVGDLQAGQHLLPAISSTHRWKRVSTTQEKNAACSSHAKETPQVYIASNVDMVEALEELPDVDPNIKNVEQQQMTQQIRKDCGDYDAVIFLARKQSISADPQ